METNGQVYRTGGFQTRLTEATRAPIVLGATNNQSKFSVYSYALNKKEDKGKGGIDDVDGEKHSFPGNISPEGYFYSPFYEVTLKELEDELQFVYTKLINFNKETATISNEIEDYYNPETGVMEAKNLFIITIITPVPYDFILHQPFCVYDVMNDMTYRGFLKDFKKTSNGLSMLHIETETQITLDGLKNGRYIISSLNDNAPLYAEYIPATNKLIWRGPKKMSDLSSDSPLYNMPFTNGRLYIHRNLNVFVRRQDPHGNFNLFRPSINNPLRRYQVEGDAKLDFDYIQYIIDSMVDAC